MELFKNYKIETEIEAYLLGFIYADGFITGKVKDRYYVLGITLSRKDEQIIQDINKVLNGRISYSEVNFKDKKYETIKFTKCDVKLIKRLERFGIIPRKTYIESEPYKYLDEKIINHFVRGFFDGDGTICQTKEGRYVSGFVGLNNKLFNWLGGILSDVLDREIKYRKDGKYLRIYFGGNPTCKKIGEFLYKNASIFLKRKKEKFDNIKITNGKYGMEGLSYQPSRRGRKKWIAHARIGNNKIYCGLFLTKQEAIDKINKIKGENKEINENIVNF